MEDGFESTTFGWVTPVVPLTQSNCWIFRKCISLQRISWYICLTVVVLYIFHLFPCVFYQLGGRPFSKNLVSVVLFFLAFILLSLKNDLQVISTAVSLSSISCFVTTLVVEILQESLLHEKIVVKGRYHLRLLFWLQDFLIKNQELRIEKPIDVLVFYAWSCSVRKNLRLTFLVRFG